MRIALAVLGALLLTGCSDSEQPRSESPPPGMLKVPKEICDEPNATLVSASEFVILGTFAKSSGVYEAAEIADAQVRNGRVYILDRGHSAIAVVDSSGKVLKKWGRRGKGPGELNDPYALDLDTAGNVYVLDRMPSIHVYDSAGTYLKSVRVPLKAEGFARLSDGSFVFVTSPNGQMEEPAAFQTDSSGKNMQTLIEVVPDEYGKRPFTGPAFTKMRVVAGPGGAAAIYYPTDNTVEVFRNGKLEHRIEGCLPASVLESYRAQRRQSGGNSQSVAGFINAVRFDTSGNIIVSRPKRGENAAITSYAPDGSINSIRRFPVRDAFGYSHNATFAGSDSEVITWNPDGELRFWRIE